MMRIGYSLRTIRLHRVLLVAAILITAVLSGASRTWSGPTVNLNGRVESNAAGLPNYDVALYAGLPGADEPDWTLLAIAATNAAGHFHLMYSPPASKPGALEPLLFIEAVSGAR